MTPEQQIEEEEVQGQQIGHHNVWQRLMKDTDPIDLPKTASDF